MRFLFGSILVCASIFWSCDIYQDEIVQENVLLNIAETDNLDISITPKVSPALFDSKKFTFSYTGKGEERQKRYDVLTTPLKVSSNWLIWKGKDYIHPTELSDVCKSVLDRLPHINSNLQIIHLLLETSIAESRGGYIIDSKYGDYGIFQMRLSASKSLRTWLKKYHKDVYIAIKKLRNDKLSEKDNLIQNIPYAIAMCVTYYWRIAGSQFYKHIASLEARAIMWKSCYNTKLGSGTVNLYMKRVLNYHTLLEG